MPFLLILISRVSLLNTILSMNVMFLMGLIISMAGLFSFIISRVFVCAFFELESKLEKIKKTLKT